MIQKNRDSLGDSDSLNAQLKAIVERAAKETGAAYAFLFLLDRGTSELQNTAWYGPEQPLEYYTAVARWVLSRGEPLFLQGEEDAGKITGRTLEKSALPLICAPVMSHATVQGVLGVGSPNVTDEGFLRKLVELQGELLGALLENMALQRELNLKEEQVWSLIRDTFEAQEAERERICLEVHDGVTQTLSSAFHYLQTLETSTLEDSPKQLLLRARELVRQAIQESREVINTLQPATLRDLGLVTTLRQEMRQLAQELGWGVEFKADAIRLPRDVETGLYRIINEAINNARKHAYRGNTDARRIRIEVACTEDRVTVEVKDWGRGFNPDSPELAPGNHGLGLLSMRKRAELLQGVFDIQSAPGQGTTVHVAIPIDLYKDKNR